MTTPQGLSQVTSQLEEEYSTCKLPPVEQWNPPLCGDIDLSIRANGEWIHEGRPIQRQSLVKLFSTVLKREGDAYFLVTPVEKWRIQVEEAPFLITRFECRNDNGVQALIFYTSTDDVIIAGPEHPIVVEEKNAQPRPFIAVRQGMSGLIHRNVFYQLVDLAEQAEDKGKKVLQVKSMGAFFILGVTE